MSVALTFCDAGFSSHLPIVELLKDCLTPQDILMLSPPPRYSHRCLRVSGLHGITIKAFSVHLQVRETLASFTYFPYYLFMIWGRGAVAFRFKRPLRENQSTILRGKEFSSLCACMSAGYVWGSFLINQVIPKQTLLRNNFQHHLPRDSVLFQQVQNWAPL